MIGKVAVLLTAIGLILSIIGIAIPYWEYQDGFLGMKMKVHSGLWQMCLVGTTSTQKISYGFYFAGCVNFEDVYQVGLRLPVPDSLKAVRALEIIGIIFLGFAVGAGVLKLIAKKHVTALFNVAGGMAILSGVLMITGTITYVAKTTQDLDPMDVLHLHAGFALCVAASGLAIIGGVLFFCDRKRQQPAGQMCRTINQGAVPYTVAYTAGRYPTGSSGAVIMTPPYDTNMSCTGQQYYAPPPAYSQYSPEPVDVKSPP